MSHGHAAARHGVPELEGGMAHDGKTPREAASRAPAERSGESPLPRPLDRIERVSLKPAPAKAPDASPPPLPRVAPAMTAKTPTTTPSPPSPLAKSPPKGLADPFASPPPAADSQGANRRTARRRAAGPARTHIAANDDAPSIGGLIFALQQKPSGTVFRLATGASAGWLVVGFLVAFVLLRQGPQSAPGLAGVLLNPMLAVAAATIVLPILLFWFLALLAWRTQELKLMSSAMTEVAVRLAEPDRAAEQAAASLGQAVRRQVSFMNEAISRALGRAGELEALVHNEVAALEKSYGENEHRIKGLIEELVGERHALVSTTDKVAETLKSMGSDVPNLIEKLSQQQIKLAKIIEGAGQNLIALENQLSTASGSLESALANRTQQLQAVLDDYTVALDATLANRAEALDIQLVERTRALDAAFSERLALFDDSMIRTSMAVDSAVNEKARALTLAMEQHVRSLSDTMGRQAVNLDQSMMHGIDAVRRTSEGITRQSLQAIEGLSGQADLLKNVSEKLLNQVSSVTSAFDHQGQSIVTAASALEHVNQRIDTTLQKRHAELSDTLQRLSGKAEQIDEVMRGYQHSVEGAPGTPEARARQLMQQFAQGSSQHVKAALAEIEHLRTQSDAHSRAVLAEFERLHAESGAHVARAIEDMRPRATGVAAIANRFSNASDDARAQAVHAAADLHLDQRMHGDGAGMPMATRESADAMRMALNEQLRALEQLSALASRERRDGVPPPSHGPMPISLAATYAAQSQPAAADPADSPERWSLGDLLARASRDEDGTQRAPAIDLENIARALDATTASAIWSRFRAGQRGIMVRSIYTSEGRVSFDELSERYGRDADFHRTVDRFLNDFERLMRDVEQRNPRGVHDHLVSDAGRVYLFLAHASGRLR
jgi:ABC-type transporter Mla subunit MlaD